MSPVTRDLFDGATADRRLASFFNVATADSFGAFSRLELSAAAAAVTYVDRTQLGKRPALSPPAREASAVLVIDAPTRANLELIRTLSGETRGSLLSVIDRTMTAAGARMLSARLASPLIEPDAINGRLDAVALLVEDARRRAELREALGQDARSFALAGAPLARPRRAARSRRRARRARVRREYRRCSR